MRLGLCRVYVMNLYLKTTTTTKFGSTHTEDDDRLKKKYLKKPTSPLVTK